MVGKFFLVSGVSFNTYLFFRDRFGFQFFFFRDRFWLVKRNWEVGRLFFVDCSSSSS